jgi:hypothetical protein
MLLINSITNDPMQQMTLTGIPGLLIDVTLRFMPRIQTWDMDVVCGNFTAQGIPLLCGPNIMRQWRNIVSFGIGITNNYFLDPFTLTDFSSGNSQFYLLNSTDVATVEATFFDGI